MTLTEPLDLKNKWDEQKDFKSNIWKPG